MDCNTVSELMRAYLNGRLPADQRKVFESHLSECSQCRIDLIMERRICKALKPSTNSPLPADFAKKIVTHPDVLVLRNTPIKRFRRYAAITAGSIAAILLFMFALPYFEQAITGTWRIANEKFSGTDLARMDMITAVISLLIPSSYGFEPQSISMPLLTIVSLLFFFGFYSAAEALRYGRFR